LYFTSSNCSSPPSSQQQTNNPLKPITHFATNKFLQTLASSYRSWRSYEDYCIRSSETGALELCPDHP
jgi:hypothetical protein